jgi:hypothetical protein
LFKHLFQQFIDLLPALRIHKGSGQWPVKNTTSRRLPQSVHQSKGFVQHHEGHEGHEASKIVTLQLVGQPLHFEIEENAWLDPGMLHVNQQHGWVNRSHFDNAP